MYLAPHNSAHADTDPKCERRKPRLALPAFAALILLLGACAEARAQQGPLGSTPRTVFQSDDDPADKQGGSREDMLRNIEIKRREQAYKENIERAKESAALGAELREAYERAKGIGPSEQKKLGRLEKLARAIREQAGGDDDKEEMKDFPPDTAASFIQLQRLSEELNKKVEKTPRHVVSTSVINTANRLLGLIRHIRASFK
jgi:hypothetical protein